MYLSSHLACQGWYNIAVCSFPSFPFVCALIYLGHLPPASPESPSPPCLKSLARRRLMPAIARFFLHPRLCLKTMTMPWHDHSKKSRHSSQIARRRQQSSTSTTLIRMHRRLRAMHLISRLWRSIQRRTLVRLLIIFRPLSNS